jgi:hypothetical protein
MKNSVDEEIKVAIMHASFSRTATNATLLKEIKKDFY